MTVRTTLALFATALAFAPCGARADDTQEPAAATPVTHATLTKALARPIATIIDKPEPSPTGDPHDYVSYARYWWPDPNKPDGLPYVRHDGHHNEAQVKKGDEPRMGAFVDQVEILATGWTKTHDPAYAARAAEWLRAWFVTPATRMNPNLEFSQIQKGHENNHGNPTGVLDGRGLARVVKAIGSLQGSNTLTLQDQLAIKGWFSSYLKWLMTSDNAKREHAAANNHGTWFLVQAIAIARFCGQDDVARRLAEEDKLRIANQIRSDGSQPLELARADGLGYSLFNLQAQFEVATLAAPLKVDLWNFQATNGASLRKAVDYLKPYNSNPGLWKGNQLKSLKPGFLDDILAQANRAWPAPLPPGPDF